MSTTVKENTEANGDDEFSLDELFLAVFVALTALMKTAITLSGNILDVAM